MPSSRTSTGKPKSGRAKATARKPAAKRAAAKRSASKQAAPARAKAAPAKASPPRSTSKPPALYYDVHPGVRDMQSWVAALKQKTGRTLVEWVELVKREGPAEETARRDWLKARH